MELTLLGAARSVFAPASRLRVETFFFKDCVCGCALHVHCIGCACELSCEVRVAHMLGHD